MISSNCTSNPVKELFDSLLINTNVQPDPPPPPPSTLPQSPRLTSPPPKNFIRRIQNDDRKRREKYDGCRWRLVCTWNDDCQNIACTSQLCKKHHMIRKGKDPTARKSKPVPARSSLPNMKPYKNSYTAHKKTFPDNDDDDDIQILEDYYVGPTRRLSTNPNVKMENPDFHVFSVEHVDEAEPFAHIKAEPRASSSSRPNTTPVDDVQYVTSTTRPNGLNINELLSKNIPPLTGFEEDCLGLRLMQRFTTTSSMIDAQLYLHKEALAIVKQNYRITMDTIAPEYFYDFLIRQPRVALHFSNWFSRCKPIPPTTGCSIDMKFWTLSMVIRGATAADNMTD